jgi:hypothetical protein
LWWRASSEESTLKERKKIKKIQPCEKCYKNHKSARIRDKHILHFVFLDNTFFCCMCTNQQSASLINFNSLLGNNNSNNNNNNSQAWSHNTLCRVPMNINNKITNCVCQPELWKCKKKLLNNFNCLQIILSGKLIWNDFMVKI